MLEFKDFKLLNNENPSLTSIKFRFIDNELSEESFEYADEKLKEYEKYLEYDCRVEFNIEYKKEVIIEMIITSPNRKVPDDKKELEEFVNMHVMDFDEYYWKINNSDDLVKDDMVVHT